MAGGYREKFCPAAIPVICKSSCAMANLWIIRCIFFLFSNVQFHLNVRCIKKVQSTAAKQQTCFNVTKPLLAFFEEVIYLTSSPIPGVLALERSHPRGGNGALLWRLFVLWTPHWEWFLLRHVPGRTEVSKHFHYERLLCAGQIS